MFPLNENPLFFEFQTNDFSNISDYTFPDISPRKMLDAFPSICDEEKKDQHENSIIKVSQKHLSKVESRKSISSSHDFCVTKFKLPNAKVRESNKKASPISKTTPEQREKNRLLTQHRRTLKKQEDDLLHAEIEQMKATIQSLSQQTLLQENKKFLEANKIQKATIESLRNENKILQLLNTQFKNQNQAQLAALSKFNQLKKTSYIFHNQHFHASTL